MSKLKSERTIRSMIHALGMRLNRLPPRSKDQAYGAYEALRWVVGDAYSVKEFCKGMDE